MEILPPKTDENTQVKHEPEPFSVYCQWKGRASRKTYWLYSLPLIVLYFMNVIFIKPQSALLFCVISLIILVPSMMINIKRSHDRGRSGWFTLLLLIPLVSLWPTIEFGFLAGSKESNKFGEPALW